ncbi:MAG: hypothetical protein QGG36_08890 [Pirellulaceae bacterium]|jgi:hypothetical protein|nr:hypothetical protein [Pirellulaceae bacterium]
MLVALLVPVSASRGQDQKELRAQNATLQRLSQMLEKDWPDRPEWASMAAALMKGEGMRPGEGWWKGSQTRYDWKWLVATFDADKSGAIEVREMELHKSLFLKLDRSGDLRLTQKDLRDPPRPSGPAAVMGEELFFRLDRDSNGKVTQDEIVQFFKETDGDEVGFFTLADLQAGLGAPPKHLQEPGNAGPLYRPGQNRMKDLEMLLSGQLGALEHGPNVNDPAPDFTLKVRGLDETVTLSKRGDRPVVLIFGSFT